MPAHWKLAVLATTVVLAPAVLQARERRPQSYQVRVRHSFGVWGDVKNAACGGTCSEGHDCTACVGVRIYAGEQPVSTTVLDKVPCCGGEGGAPATLNALSLLSPWCGVHSCPATTVAGNRGPFVAELDRVIGCVGERDPVLVPEYVAVLGSLSNNALNCGSRCSATDPFRPFGPAWRQDARYGGFVADCVSGEPSVVCEPVDQCPTLVEPSQRAVREAGPSEDPLPWGVRRMRGARRRLDAAWAVHRRVL